MMIKRFLEQSVLGYSADFKKTHLMHLVELEDGTHKTMYQTDTEINGCILQGQLTEMHPFIEVPLESITADKAAKPPEFVVAEDGA
jgi:hypothetical protein